jgi:hypothetical protein
MRPTCALSLLSAEPVVETRIYCRWTPDGLSIVVRHRHHGGLFTDCEPLECEKLSFRETHDVLQLLVDDLGPLAATRAW